MPRILGTPCHTVGAQQLVDEEQQGLRGPRPGIDGEPILRSAGSAGFATSPQPGGGTATQDAGISATGAPTFAPFPPEQIAADRTELSRLTRLAGETGDPAARERASFTALAILRKYDEDLASLYGAPVSAAAAPEPADIAPLHEVYFHLHMSTGDIAYQQRMMAVYPWVPEPAKPAFFHQLAQTRTTPDMLSFLRDRVLHEPAVEPRSLAARELVARSAAFPDTPVGAARREAFWKYFLDESIEKRRTMLARMDAISASRSGQQS